jgi:cell wall-associated NlpC family hydrolase
MKWMVFPRIILCLFLVLSLFPENAIAEEEYRVQRGDTLSAIARKTGVTINALKETNHLKGDRLKINQHLVIPFAKKDQKRADIFPKPEFYEVKKGDSLSRIAKKTGVSVDELSQINNLSSSRLKIGQKLLLEKRKETAATTDALPSEQIPTLTTNEKQNQESEKKADDLAASPSTFPQNKEPYYNKEKLLGKWTSPNEQQLLVKVALGFLGAPYRHGGCSVRGIDCSGFVKKIYALFDIDLPRTAAEQSTVGMHVAKSDLIEGDLIFFNTKKRINHVGIYIGKNKFVHAASHNRGVSVDSLDSSYYKRHYKRAVRLKGSDDIPSSDDASALLKEPNHDLFAQTSFTKAHR